MAALKKEELKIYDYGKGKTIRNNVYAIGEYGSEFTGISRKLEEISATLMQSTYATRVLPYQNGENERLRKLRVHQWRANTLPNFSESEGYVLIDGIKAYHVLKITGSVLKITGSVLMIIFKFLNNTKRYACKS